MAQYTSYDQVGIKEDISDKISMITPTKTPFQTLIGDVKVHNRTFEWQEDSLAAVRDNKNVEGFTASDATLTPTVLRNNTTQILEKTVKISRTSDDVATYGRAKETALQLAKASSELKRDLEHAFVGLDNAAVAGSSGVAREMSSAFDQIHADVTGGHASSGALTEAYFLDVNQKLYNEGGEAEYFMVKPADSLIVAGWATASGRERDFGTGKTVVNCVDLLVTPFGEQRVVLNRFIKSTEALLIDPSCWKKAVLRNWTRTKLAKDGDNDKHLIVGEFSLKHENYKASGRIENLT